MTSIKGGNLESKLVCLSADLNEDGMGDAAFAWALETRFIEPKGTLVLLVHGVTFAEPRNNPIRWKALVDVYPNPLGVSQGQHSVLDLSNLIQDTYGWVRKIELWVCNPGGVTLPRLENVDVRHYIGKPEVHGIPMLHEFEWVFQGPPVVVPALCAAA